jgi:hypothetical protein
MQGLLRFTAALEATGVTPWIQDGTLLGLVRGGDLIKWDKDTDFGLSVKDWNEDRQQALLDAGFENRRHFGTLENGYQIHWYWQNEKFDLFFYYDNPDQSWWHAAYKKQQQYRYTYERFDVSPVRFGSGHLYTPPRQYFLDTKYGDWHTPVRYWDYATGPLNSSLGR